MGTPAPEAGVLRAVARYALLYDDADADGWIALFTADASLEAFGSTHRGRDAILAAIGPSPDRPPAQHMTYNTVVDVDPDGRHARAVSDFCYLQRGDGGLVPAHAGRYYDRFVLDGDEWRFASRTIRLLGTPPPEQW